MIISVTGHRHLDHSIDDVIDTFGWFLQNLKPKLVVTGMALGFDQAVALSCLKNDMPFEAAVPCDGQERLWPNDAQETYRELLKLADKTTIVSAGAYAAWKMHARNAYMVKKADLVIAYCHPGATSGGTYQAMQLAKSTKGKQLVNMYELVGKPELLQKVFLATTSVLVRPNRNETDSE